ncbi:hypothetical protein BD779DRAFT_1680925 [Infundibulicybe gibba]|nr:hypothetical protein BD779DRAFT_1680925 [Infundibulicybe gibba]
MSRHGIATAARQYHNHAPNSQEALSPELRAWSCHDEYGENGVAKAKMKGEESERMAQGYRNHLEGPPIAVEAKPSSDERVIVEKLPGDDISIRIWGDAYNDCFCFDFVNGQGRYIWTPPHIKIYTTDGPQPGAEVFSIERSWPNMDQASRTRGYDPDWETYVIAGGIRLRIARPGHQDCYFTIPSRRPQDSTYIAIPEYW